MLAPEAAVRDRFEAAAALGRTRRVSGLHESAADRGLEELRRRARAGPLTIVYAARDRGHNTRACSRNSCAADG